MLTNSAWMDTCRQNFVGLWRMLSQSSLYNQTEDRNQKPEVAISQSRIEISHRNLACK